MKVVAECLMMTKLYTALRKEAAGVLSSCWTLAATSKSPQPVGAEGDMKHVLVEMQA